MGGARDEGFKLSLETVRKLMRSLGIKQQFIIKILVNIVRIRVM